MTATRSGRQVRPGSSRGPSVAREIMKRRDRPYKTEKQKVLTRKKKLQFNTSYRTAPDGWTFVAVGTPELSERCKELSRQKGFPVSVVNARHNRNAMNPTKVSFHVHRIGYHFKTEIVEQACEETGYQLSHDAFIKTADLQAQIQKSHVARIMARHGLQMNQAPVEGVQDTPAQVRAAIKELFPKIPDEDLDKIVTHAWEKGSDRVGTNPTLELSRRVQLATVARIRHVYTDYDRLLKAFDWGEARGLVEPDTLRKLIEWRGENDEDDNELEEIVRETIVIDDDNDDRAALGYGTEADDEDSDANDISDASIEVTHHVVADDDMGAESLDETGRHFLQRLQPRLVRNEQQNSIARQKIEAARQRLRLAPPPQTADVVPVNVQMDERGLPPNAIIIDGKVYQRAAPVHDVPPPPVQMFYPPQPHGTYADRYRPQVSPNIMQTHNPAIPRSIEARPRETVMPSIEPHVPVATREMPYSLHHGAAPATPDNQHPNKRQRVEYSQTQPQATAVRLAGGDKYRPAPSRQPASAQPLYRPRQDHETIDLTSPERVHHSSNPSPLRAIRGTFPRPPEDGGRAQYYQSNQAVSLLAPPNPGSELQSNVWMADPDGRQRAPEAESYDPRQPLVQFPDRRTYQESHLLPAAPGQSTPSRVTYGTAIHSPMAPTMYTPQAQQPPAQPPPLAPHHQVLYHDPQIRYLQVPQPLPQPVHGAPAPVQQSPYDIKNVQTTSLQPYQSLQHVASPAPFPPVNGAPHPAQYFYSR